MKGHIVAFAIFLLIALCNGHTILTNLTIAGRTTDACLRPFMNWDGHNAPDFPIMGNSFPQGVMGINYTCGWTDAPNSGGALPAATTCEIAAGSTVRSNWWHGAREGEDPAVDNYIHNSHHGPFMVYMAKWDETGVGLPNGPAWFKIYESAILVDHREFWNVQWASPHGLNTNSGGLDFSVPAQLQPGKYLLRFEIIALHDTIKQPYVRCADVVVTGSGTVQPTQLISIPGTIQLDDPGLTYNMYQLDNRPPYPIPGPRPYNFTAVPSSSDGVPNTSVPTNSDLASTSTSEEGTASLVSVSIALLCAALYLF